MLTRFDCDNDGVWDWVCEGDWGYAGALTSSRFCDFDDYVTRWPYPEPSICPWRFGGRAGRGPG